MGEERRVACCAGIGDILIIGEQLRLELHTNSLGLIRDRRYHFKSYTTCMVGTEIVDWLVKTGQAPGTEVALILLNILLENQVLHHVNDSQIFKYDSQLYRFRKDDGSFQCCEDLVTYHRAQRMYNRLLGPQRPNFVSSQQEDGVTYHSSFQGCHLVSWMINNQEVTTREQATKELRHLIHNGVIKHVSNSHDFRDDLHLYQFTSNFGRKRILLDLVLPPPEVEEVARAAIERQPVADPTIQVDNSPAQDIPDAGQVSGSPGLLDFKRPGRTESGYHSDHPDEGSSCSAETGGSPDLYDSQSPLSDSLHITPQTGMLIRKATVTELLDPKTPYKKRHIRIASDPVGFGFVIRGEGPVFVKTVDPTGPAAVAGLRVGHFIYKVNEKPVLEMHHKDLAHVILENARYVSLVVMEHSSDLLS